MNGDETEADPDAVFRNVFPFAAIVPPHDMCTIFCNKSSDRLHQHNFFTFDSLHFARKVITSSDVGKQIVMKRVESCKSDTEIYCRQKKIIFLTKTECQNCVCVGRSTSIESILDYFRFQISLIKTIESMCKYFHNRFSIAYKLF